jgi:hypothetical protein
MKKIILYLNVTSDKESNTFYYGAHGYLYNDEDKNVATTDRDKYRPTNKGFVLSSSKLPGDVSVKHYYEMYGKRNTIDEVITDIESIKDDAELVVVLMVDINVQRDKLISDLDDYKSRDYVFPAIATLEVIPRIPILLRKIAENNKQVYKRVFNVEDKDYFYKVSKDRLKCIAATYNVIYTNMSIDDQYILVLYKDQDTIGKINSSNTFGVINTNMPDTVKKLLELHKKNNPIYLLSQIQLNHIYSSETYMMLTRHNDFVKYDNDEKENGYIV